MTKTAQERLDDARWELLFAQRAIRARAASQALTGTFDYHCTVQRFYAALDRVWEAQCMAQASPRNLNHRTDKKGKRPCTFKRKKSFRYSVTKWPPFVMRSGPAA